MSIRAIVAAVFVTSISMGHARSTRSIWLLLVLFIVGAPALRGKDLHLSDFGGRADGKTDDGPAIQRMVEAARVLKGEHVRLVFPKNKLIHAAAGKDRYLFALQHTENIAVDGGGSTFLLDPGIRMMDLDHAKNPVIENCIFTCFNWAYGFSAGSKHVEGPGPEFLKIKDSEFRVGRGSGMVFGSGGKGPFETTRVQNIHIENSTFHAPMRIDKARAITLINNRFHSEVMVGGHEALRMHGNTRNGKPFTIK